MLKTVEDVSATKKRLKIEVPSEIIEKEIQQALNKLRARVKIPGFRQGKAPMALLEKRFGKEAETEAMERVIPEVYADALKEAKITPVSHPVVEEQVDYKRNADLSMTLLVEVMPEIEDLRYEGIKVKEIPVRVEEEDVEKTLRRLQEQKTVYEPSDEPAAMGDMVVLDYAVKGEDKAYSDQVFKVGAETMPGEFSQALVGMKKGEDKEIGVTFPGDFPVGEMAGKRSEFKVSVKEVKKGTLPPVDDEFAKDLEFESLDALREHIRQKIRKSQEEAIDSIMRGELIKKLIEAHELEPPESLVQAELNRMVDEARAKGRTEPEEALRQEFRETARRHTQASVLIRAVGQREGVSVSDDDVKDKVAWLAERMNLSPENVIKYYVTRDGSLEGLRNGLYEEKVLDLLMDKAVREKGEQ